MEERKWGEGLSASFLAFLDGFYIGKTGEGYRR